MKKCVIIYNPNSGKKRIKEYIPEIQKILIKHEYESEVITTKYKGHATTIVKELPKTDLVMSFRSIDRELSKKRAITTNPYPSRNNQ